jgi:hypothetical protein
LKIAPYSGSAVPSLFSNYTSPVDDATPILTLNFGGDIPSPSKDTVRTGLINLNNSGDQLGTNFAFQSGLLNREADGFQSITPDTVYITSNQGNSNNSQYMIIQFTYTPNQANASSGSFGFVIQNTSVIQSTSNPGNNYDNYTSLKPNTCFLPTLKWVCNYGNGNDWVGVSSGNDGNFVIKPADEYTTKYVSGNQVTVIFEMNLETAIPMWTYFGDVTSSNFSNASPFTLVFDTENLAVPDFTQPLYFFQWNEAQGTFSTSGSDAISVSFDSTLDVVNPNYNYLESYVECPNGVNTNICIPNLDPVTMTSFDNGVPDYFTVGVYNPLKSAENYSVKNKASLRSTIQQIGNSAQSTEFSSSSPNLCPNGVDFCVPPYIYDDNNSSSLNYIVNYTPVPSLYAAAGSVFQTDIRASQCFSNPKTAPQGYSSCQDYFDNEYSYLPENIKDTITDILNGSINYPLFGAYGPSICSFTGQCTSPEIINSNCTDNTDVNSALPPFTKSSNLDPFLVGYPCASFTSSNPVIQTDEYQCGPKSPWSTAFMTRYTCDPSPDTGSDLIYNQFTAQTVPVPVGKGTNPSMSAYDLCGYDCSSSQAKLSGGWQVSCANNFYYDSSDQSILTAGQPISSSSSLTGCYASLSYNPNKAVGSVIGPSLCLTNNNGLGLNMGAVNVSDMFSPSSNGTFGVFSAFDQGDQVNSFLFQTADKTTAANQKLETCPYPSPTGLLCSDVFESFYGWDYAQMFFNQTPGGTNDSFSTLPYAQQFIYSNDLPGTCDQMPFPPLFS